MHDHATDGGLVDFATVAGARGLRLHLDNAHDTRTSGLDFPHLADLHCRRHGVTIPAVLQDAANMLAERLGGAPARVVDRILGDRSLYLSDANDTLYLAEPVDPRHMPGPGPLYRLTVQEPPADHVDLLAATKASLAATSAWLEAHKASEAIPSEALGEESGSADRRPSPSAPSSEEAGPLPCPADSAASSGSTCSGGAS